MTDPAPPALIDAAPTHVGDGAAPVCPNCATERLGDYCHGCGQRELGGRLTFRRVWGEFASRAFNLDRGLLHTVVSLARSPGAVPRDYVEGRRRTYTNPLSFLLLTAAFGLLTMGLYEAEMREQMRSVAAVQQGEQEATHAGHDHADEPNPFEAHFGSEEAVTVAVMEEWMAVIKRWTTYLTLLLCVPLVALLRVLFGPARNVAELSVFALYTVGLGTLVTAVIMPPIVHARWTMSPWFMVLGVGLYVAITAWGVVRFYDERPVGAALRGAAAMTVAYGVYLVVVSVFGAAVAFFRIAEEVGLSPAEVVERLAT